MPSTIDADKLENLGFTKHELLYLGCPEHPSENGWNCPLDEFGNCKCKSGKAPYWSIDGENIGIFTKNKKNISDFITYVFAESDYNCRKIGEGKVYRLRANLKAHYNHGLTKSRGTARDRKSSNTIAKRCRKNEKSYVFIRSASSKDEANLMERKIKQLYAGWLDYDQK